MKEHPQVAFRSCQICQKYLFDDDTGKPVEKFPGVLYERPENIPTPCKRPGPYKVNPADWFRESTLSSNAGQCNQEEGTNCPKVSPDANVALTEQNLRAYEHYQECRAVGDFPDDPLVRRHAMIIRSIEDALEKKQLVEIMKLFLRS